MDGMDGLESFSSSFLCHLDTYNCIPLTLRKVRHVAQTKYYGSSTMVTNQTKPRASSSHSQKSKIMSVALPTVAAARWVCCGCAHALRQQ